MYKSCEVFIENLDRVSIARYFAAFPASKDSRFDSKKRYFFFINIWHIVEKYIYNISCYYYLRLKPIGYVVVILIFD